MSIDLSRLKACAVPTALGAVAGLVLAGGLLGGEAALSTTAFCTSCHSMTYPAAELKKSSHHGSLGVDPQCKDCHIPQGLANFPKAVWAHVLYGTRDLINELTHDYSDVQAFNKRRLEMAHFTRMVMKGDDSLTCRTCHKDPRPKVAEGRVAHQKMETEGATCIDCHQNLVHKAVAETDLKASLSQGQMVLKE